MIDDTCQVILCDGGCTTKLELDPAAGDREAQESLLIPPWRCFELAGWIGTFHACSDVCEQRVRREKSGVFRGV